MWVVTLIETNYETSEIIGPFNSEAQAEQFVRWLDSPGYGVEQLLDPNALQSTWRVAEPAIEGTATEITDAAE